LDLPDVAENSFQAQTPLYELSILEANSIYTTLALPGKIHEADLVIAYLTKSYLT